MCACACVDSGSLREEIANLLHMHVQELNKFSGRENISLMQFAISQAFPAGIPVNTTHPCFIASICLFLSLLYFFYAHSVKFPLRMLTCAVGVHPSKNSARLDLDRYCWILIGKVSEKRGLATCG